MAIADMHIAGEVTAPVVRTGGDERRYHRIRTVRLREGVSLRSAARQMGTDIRSLRLQEQESTDLAAE